jgi:hypothetical protein
MSTQGAPGALPLTLALCFELTRALWVGLTSLTSTRPPCYENREAEAEFREAEL